jgi:pimeloyl-ACP methyl ester carboxylesterase
MKHYKTFITFVVINYVVFGGFLSRFQDFFLYFPTPPIKNHGLIERDFQVDDEIIIKTFVVNPGYDNAVLYFGGNAESVGHNASYFKAILPGQTVYLINYRGYGGSSGKPSEAALYSDALYIHDELKRQHSEIAVIGRSLGSGVATYLAAERAINKLVLVTPFDSIEQVAQKTYSLYPITLMLTDKYDSLSRANRIKAKVLILVAEKDQIIESWSSDNLIAGFRDSQVDVHVMGNTDHNSISQHPEYYFQIGKFLAVKSKKQNGSVTE